MFLESTLCEKIFTAKVHPEINITEIDLLQITDEELPLHQRMKLLDKPKIYEKEDRPI